jgi:SAM-dependent methyltransferase
LNPTTPTATNPPAPAAPVLGDERRYYDRYWANPDEAPPAHDPTTPTRKRMLRDALAGLPAGSRVWDVGCGAGEFTDYLRQLGHRPLGTDLSERAVAHAAKQFGADLFRAATPEEVAADMPGAFAAAWSSEVIEHVFDVYGFLTAIHRCLADGGLLVLTTPFHGLVKNLLIDLAGYANHYNPFGGHIRFFDRRNMTRALTHCGFTPQWWSGYGRPWPLYKSFFVVAKKTHAPAPLPPADG